MILKRQFDFDVVPGGQPLIIRASKNDSSSQIILNLYAGVGKLSVPDSAEVFLLGSTLRNQVHCLYSSLHGIPQVIIDLSKGITGKAGKKRFELAIIANDDSGVEHKFVTSTFIMDIRAY